jgi:hypothetical protein
VDFEQYPLPTIQKQKQTMDHINQLGKVTIFMNNINTNHPVEVGFFIHASVSHNTNESQRLIKKFLPIDCPEFQQDIAHWDQVITMPK